VSTSKRTNVATAADGVRGCPSQDVDVLEPHAGDVPTREETFSHKYGRMDSMRTTVDIPDAIYRRLKSRAASEGRSTKALILRGVKEVLKTTRRKAGRQVSLPIVRSRRPGSVELDNARIYEIISFP
jgi:plasmid stability protein